MQQKKHNGADTEGPFKIRTSVLSPPKEVTSTVQSKPELKGFSRTNNSLSVKKLTPDIHNVTDKSVQLKSPESYAAKSDATRSVDLKASKKPSSQQVPCTAARPLTHQVTATSEKSSSQVSNVLSRPSRPLSAPLVVGPRPTAPVVSIAQTPPLLARSLSMSGQLGPDPSAATHSYVPQSYRNAMMGSHVTGSSAGFDQPQSSLVVSASHSHSQPPHALISAPFSQGPEIAVPSSIRPSFSYEMMNHGVIQNGPQWMEMTPQRDSRSIAHDFPVLNDSRNSYLYKPVNSRSHDDLPSLLPAGTSRRQSPSLFTDEFPHLDIINDLLDDEHGLGMVSEKDASFQSFSNGFHNLTRHSTIPGDLGMSSDAGPSMSSCRFERTQSYGNMFQHSYSGGVFDGVTDMIPQASQQSFVNGKMNGLIPDHWEMVGSSPYLGMSNADTNAGYPYHMMPDYSNMACGVNGYTVFRTSNGL